MSTTTTEFSFPTCTAAGLLASNNYAQQESFVRPPYVTSVVLERLEEVAKFQRRLTSSSSSSIDDYNSNSTSSSYNNNNFNNNNNDISVLFDVDATRNQQEDYIVGLVWSSFALLLVGLLWFVMLSFCKLWGPATVGFCSARRLKPHRPDEPTHALAKKEAIEDQQRRLHDRRSAGGVPFQHNGIASGYDDAPSSPSRRGAAKAIVKAPKKLVKGTIKAPKKVISKARKQKRKIEQQFNKTKKFERMQSGIDFPVPLDDDDDDHDDDHDEYDHDDHDHDENDHDHNYEQQQEGNDSDSDDDESSVLLLTQDDEREIADYEAALLVYYKVCEKRNTRMRRIRATASLCCATIIIAAVLFVVYGTTSLTNTTTSMTNGIQQLREDVSSKISVQVNEWMTVLDQTTQATKKFVDTTLFNDEFCPGNNGPFCTTITTTTTESSDNNDSTSSPSSTRVCDFTQLQQQLDADNVAYDDMWNYLDGTLDLVLEEGILELQADLQRWNDYMVAAEENLNTFTWAFWAATGCNLALAVICLSLLVAVLCLYFGKPLSRYFKCIRSWLFLPMMLLLTTLGWIFMAIFVSWSLANADACINTPDSAVLTILKSMRSNGGFDGSILPDFLSFFVNGCSSSSDVLQPRELDQKIVIVEQLVLPTLQNVQNTISQGTSSLQTFCGTEADMSPFGQLIDALATQLCTLVESLALVRSEFNCGQWYPFYEDIVYENMCYDGTTGLVWAASCQLAIVVLIMILLTLRVAYYELDEVAEESSGSCCSDWCCSTTNTNSIKQDDESVDGDGYRETDNRKVTTSGVTEVGSLEDAQ